MKRVQSLALAAVVAGSLWMLSADASAANCNFNRNEKISMVSWIIPIAGAVITPMACRRDMFNKKNKGAAIDRRTRVRAEDESYADRRRRRRG